MSWVDQTGNLGIFLGPMPHLCTAAALLHFFVIVFIFHSHIMRIGAGGRRQAIAYI